MSGIMERKVDITQVTAEGHETERADRFPALWRRKDGSLLLVYQEISGVNRFDARRRCHVMLASADGGKVWREEKRALPWERGDGSADNASAGDAGSPGDYCRFTALPDGRLVYYGQGRGNAILVFSGNEFRDRESEWEILHPQYSGGPCPQCLYDLRVLPDGVWAMMGAWCERKSEGRDTWRRGLNKAGLMFMVSKDEGKTWQTRSVLYEGRTFPYQLCEPSWIISSGGHFRVFTREDLGFGPGVEFLSKDQGKTWESSPMRFMGHHIFADFLPDGKGVLASFRVAHYIHMPAVGMWWDDGSKWGKFLHLDNIFTNERYHADVSQWIDLGHGTYMVAYSLPPRPGSEVRVKVARFRLDQFIAPGVCGASK